MNRTTTRSALSLLASVGLAAAVTGQATLPSVPAGGDMPGAFPQFLMMANSRSQQFYEATTRPVSDASAYRELAFRFDGPTGGGPAHVATIELLEIWIGVTHKSVAEIGADFDANLTEPLRRVAEIKDWAFATDTVSTTQAELFGGVGGGLRFQFPEPYHLPVPVGSCLVVEIRAHGNSNVGQHSAMLDGHFENPVGGVPSAERNEGPGCPIASGAEEASLEIAGQMSIGTAFTTFGRGYGPHQPVATLLTFDLLHPYMYTAPMIPGARPCRLGVDPLSGPVATLRIADANGELAPWRPGSSIPLPPLPSLCGDLLYVQNISPMPNGIGVQTSNYRTIAVGCPPPPAVPAKQVTHHLDPTAPIASVVAHAALALELR